MSTNIFKRLGAGELTWDVDGTAVIMGPTNGGIMLTNTQNTIPINEDAYGTTPVDAITAGNETKLELTMSKMTAERLAEVHGVQQLTGPVFKFNISVGESLRELAKKIRIKPITNLVTSTTSSEWITIPLASPPLQALEIGFDAQKERVWKVTFMIFPDDSTGNLGNFFSIG